MTFIVIVKSMIGMRDISSEISHTWSYVIKAAH